MAIGERIKLLRRASGLSQRALAEKVGVSAQAISKYERELDIPSSAVLLSLAQALDVRTEYFLRPTPQLKVNPVFRSRRGLGKKAHLAIAAQIQEWLERYLAVESLFPRDQMPRFQLPARFLWPVASLEDAETAAAILRQEWELGEAPIDDLTELLEFKGIKVGLIDGDDDFDACYFPAEADSEIHVIALEKGKPGDRQRFSLAHELGHLVMEISEDAVVLEEAVNRFAAAFLVPTTMARYELGTHRDALDFLELHLLKHKYGLSMQAWIKRAWHCDIISEALAKRLLRLFRQRGWDKVEPGDQIPPEEPRRMKRLMLRALAEDLISKSRARELLGQPLSEFWKHETIAHEGFPVGVRG